MNTIEAHEKAEWTTPVMLSIETSLTGVLSGFGALDDGGSGFTTSSS